VGPAAAAGVLGLAAVVAMHELAEVVVIANGIRAGRRTAFGEHAASPASSSTAVPITVEEIQIGGCDDGCCVTAVRPEPASTVKLFPTRSL